MAQPETILGLSSVDIALGSAAISFTSACIAGRIAWVTKFAPAKLVGTFPYAIIWTFVESKDRKPSVRYIVPAFWLSNIGARPMLVDDLRLVLRPTNAKPVLLYPTHTVPIEAIESPNSFNDHDLLRTGKAPFSGFSIASSETWFCCYAFHISDEQRSSLKGLVEASVEIRPVRAARFKTVLADTFTFEKSSFNWLSWAGVGGPQANYYYSGAKRDRTTH